VLRVAEQVSWQAVGDEEENPASRCPSHLRYATPGLLSAIPIMRVSKLPSPLARQELLAREFGASAAIYAEARAL